MTNRPSSPAQDRVPAAPAVVSYDFGMFGEIEHQPVSGIRKVIAERVTASWAHVPQVTQYDAVDVTDLEVHRTQRASDTGLKLTLLPFLIRILVTVLKDHPKLNASLDPSGETLILKKYCNIGIAVDTPLGLLVPVLHNADRFDVLDLAARIAELGVKARAGKLAFTDAEGGSFTVTSLGRLGGNGFSPIVNAPEVAVLGIARAEDRAVVRDGHVVIRRMLPISLTYDHRVIDGAEGGRFLEAFRNRLADLDAMD